MVSVSVKRSAYLPGSLFQLHLQPTYPSRLFWRQVHNMRHVKSMVW
jgi:hypothetical protein